MENRNSQLSEIISTCYGIIWPSVPVQITDDYKFILIMYRLFWHESYIKENKNSKISLDPYTYSLTQRHFKDFYEFLIEHNEGITEDSDIKIHDFILFKRKSWIKRINIFDKYRNIPDMFITKGGVNCLNNLCNKLFKCKEMLTKYSESLYEFDKKLKNEYDKIDCEKLPENFYITLKKSIIAAINNKHDEYNSYVNKLLLSSGFKSRHMYAAMNFMLIDGLSKISRYELYKIFEKPCKDEFLLWDNFYTFSKPAGKYGTAEYENSCKSNKEYYINNIFNKNITQ